MTQTESQSQEKVNAEVLLAFKSAAGDPPSLKSWMGREPCLQSWIGVQCSGKFHNSTVIAVKLTGYELEGVISPAIQNLTSLVTFSVQMVG